MQLVAFILAECQVLLLPLDVLNSRDNTNIDMFTLWQIIYMTSLCFITVILPFTYFFYETDEDYDFVS